MMYWGYGYDQMGWGAFHGLFMFFFWFLVIAFFVLLIKKLSGSNRGAGENKALGILQERYARGEIGKQEFEEKKKDLM
ncbi:MAG: SHOCT domain-containing protein [Patescibacteria group bacterium]|nr:SHOCT domain-containing protein [bacterium]MDZ4240536.1 SHOCT domain-containing protein [Patescibacteria group bacterium]